jgi:hypothetical protein
VGVREVVSVISFVSLSTREESFTFTIFFIFRIFQHISSMYIFYEQFMCISFLNDNLYMHIIFFRMLIYMYKFF